MAANNSFESEKRSLECSVLFYRLRRVIGTTGKEAAILPQQRADRILVTANQCQKQFHGLTSNIACSAKQVPNFLGQGPPVERQGKLDGQSNDQIAAWQFGVQVAECFTNQAPEQIAINRTAKVSLGDNETQPGADGMLDFPRAVM